MDMGRMQGSNDITRGPGPSLPLVHTLRYSQGQAGDQGVTWCTVKNMRLEPHTGTPVRHE